MHWDEGNNCKDLISYKKNLQTLDTCLSPSLVLPGGYSTLVWVGVCRWDFWNATHPCTHFEGKVTHPCTKNQNFSLKFAPFWRKFRKVLKSWPIKVPNLRHFGANFRKFWKIDPSKYHVFEKRDPLMYLAAWFCYPCLRHIPITTFVLSTPPGLSYFDIFYDNTVIWLESAKGWHKMTHVNYL